MTVPAPRDRAGVVVVVDGRLALIDRVRDGAPPYSVVPGGGVEPGETFAEAAVREAEEELGLAVDVSDGPAIVVRGPGHVEQYFRAEVMGGTFGTGTGPEREAGRGRGTSTPVLVTPEEAVHRRLEPVVAAEAVLRGFVTGDWTAVEVTDPTGDAPARERAAGFCLDDDDCVLLLTGEHGDRGHFFEVPGGGVEAGETPEDAAVRELEEELGLHVRIERPLATIWRPGGVSVRQHYFLVRPDGPSGRTTLDHEPFFTPVRVPAAELSDLPVWPKRLGWRFAHWATTGAWPDVPLVLSDVIRDLRPPCRW